MQPDGKPTNLPIEGLRVDAAAAINTSLTEFDLARNTWLGLLVRNFHAPSFIGGCYTELDRSIKHLS
jgi:hypothetical protein